MRKLNEREKRIVAGGVVAAAAILVLAFGTKGYDRWQSVRSSLNSARRQIADVTVDPVKQAGLLSIVPVAELPAPEDKQRFLFRDKLYEQLKKAGIKVEPLTIRPARRKAGLPYQVVLIECKGKCSFDQLLAFLATLNENPYLVGVEELRFKCDPKQAAEQRKEIEINLTVSTFVQSGSNAPQTSAALLQ